MARIKGATMTHKRRAKTLKLAKGYYGAKSKHFRMAKQAVMKSGRFHPCACGCSSLPETSACGCHS